jgi:4-oxalocrotonate tautomerase
MMPLVRVSMLKGKPPEYINALSESIYQALVESYGMPENDHFQIIEQLEPGSLRFDRNYRATSPRSDDALYKLLVEKLAKSPGVRPEDVFVTLDVNTVLEDWSFGNGISAAK